jgi:hypothetical protein
MNAYFSCLHSDFSPSSLSLIHGSGKPLETTQRINIEGRRMAFINVHASGESIVETGRSYLSDGRASRVGDDVDETPFVALLNRSDKKPDELGAICFNELIKKDLLFLTTALKKVCRCQCSYTDQFVHILAQAVAFKYRQGGGYDPDNPDAFIALFEEFDNEYPSIAPSLKMYVYLFLPLTERLHLNGYLSDHLSVEGFVKQNPQFRFLQGRCSEIIEVCPSLPRIFKRKDLKKYPIRDEMISLINHKYGLFWGALVDRGACPHGFNWEEVFWDSNVDMLRRMPIVMATGTSDPCAIDPNEVMGEMDKYDRELHKIVHDPGMPVLTWISLRGNEKLVKALLDKGANPFVSMNSIWSIYQGQKHNEKMCKICALVLHKAYQIEEQHALRSPMFKDVEIFKELLKLIDPFVLLKNLSKLKDEMRILVLNKAYEDDAERLFNIMRYNSPTLRKRIFELMPDFSKMYRSWHINQKMKEEIPALYGHRSSEVGVLEADELRKAHKNRRRILPGNPESRYSVDDMSIYPPSTLSLEELGKHVDEEIEILRRELRRDDPATWVQPRVFELPSVVAQENSQDLVSCSNSKSKKGCCCTIL